MTLLELRKKLRAETGRFDLVNQSGTDNGADFYINEGIKFLDQITEFSKAVGRYMVQATSGQFLFTFQNCRAIKEVWASDYEVRWELIKKDFTEMRQKYNADPSDQDTGTAKYYTPAFIRPIPDELTSQDLTDLGLVAQYIDFMQSGHETYNGIIVLPPTDETILIEVIGLFYSKELSDEDDTNFWTEMHPDLVIMAAAAKMEAMNRNTQGFKDWIVSIRTYTDEITKDWIEQEAEEHDQIGG